MRETPFIISPLVCWQFLLCRVQQMSIHDCPVFKECNFENQIGYKQCLVSVPFDFLMEIKTEIRFIRFHPFGEAVFHKIGLGKV